MLSAESYISRPSLWSYASMHCLCLQASRDILQPWLVRDRCRDYHLAWAHDLHGIP